MSSKSGRSFVGNASWEEKVDGWATRLRPRRLRSASGSADLGVRRRRGARRHRRHHRPQRSTHPSADAGWQAGTCNAEPPEAGEPARSPPRASSSNRPPAHPLVGFTQFIVKTRTLPGRNPGRRTEDVRVDLPVGPQRQPAGDRRSARWPTSKPSASACPRSARKSAKASSPSALLGSAPSTAPASPGARLQRRTRSRAAGPLRPRTSPATKSSSKATSTGPATTTRGSRSTSRALPTLEPAAGERPDPEEPPRLQRPRRRRDLPHHAHHLPRTRDAEPAPAQHIYSTFLRADSLQEETNPATASPPAPPAFESPIPPGHRIAERTATRSPTTRRSASTPDTAADRLARRRRRVEVDVPRHHRRRRTGQLRTPRTATVTLPVGMGLNPSAANGLQTCTDAQFGKGTEQPGRLPGRTRRSARSTIETPPLPERHRSTGNVYVGQQLSRDPDLRQRVPDLRRRRVGPLRDLGAADRQRQRRPADRAADDDLRRNPAGARSPPSSSTSTAARGRC